jgi:diguanylate cyclase (GGDEF)-like protein/PAS domain S-box-containing protein
MDGRLVSTITPEISMTPRLAGRGWAIYALAALIPILLLVVIWAAALYVIHLERAATEQAAIHSSQEILETYDAQMVRNLGAIDQTLKIVKFSFELERNKFSLPDLREKGLLPSSVVFDVRLANEHGDILGDVPKDLPTNVAHEPYFQEQIPSDTGLPYVGKASKNAASGLWELQFSRRLNAPDGSFAGVVILSVDPAYFTSGYEHSRLAEYGMVGLLGADGEFRVIRSGDDVSSGQNVDYNAATHDADGSYAAGVLMQSPWDKRFRYTSARALHGYPLTAIVGLSRDEQFASYEQHRRNYLWEAAGASALLLLIGVALGTLSWQLTESRREFRKIQQTYHAASEASVDAFYVLQTVFANDGSISDFQIRDANIRGAELLGTHKQGLIGKNLRAVFPAPEFERIFADLASVAMSGTIHETEWRNSSQVFRAEWLYRQVVRVEDGVMAIVRDISERKRMETKIQFQATHDSLTGLANRNLLHDRLNQAIAQAQRSDSGVWVIFVDLDRFKVVNDSLGHKAGDSFLTTISERLQSAVRDADTVARLGGDEFVLILPEIGPNSLNANSVQRVMQVISQPIQIEQKEFSLNCSIGVAIFPNDGDTAGQLIERADIAMYRAKETGRNNFQFFTAEMNERLLERLRIEEAMRNAVDRGEFVLYYQPQIDLRSGEVIGAEALLRWQHPEMGMVSPARFIGLAEETGLIIEIGQWALRHACNQHMAWQNAGLGRLRMAVNLSARQFSQPDLVESVAKALADSGMAPQDLELELTEGMVMADVESAIATLRDLKTLNVQLAIDDFGTGYSSLSYLKRFPIDVLKIDRSFVNDIAHSPDDATIVLSIVSLAHNLRLRVIAEGVETEAQLAYLQKHDCDEMQGFYFSRPLPAIEFAQLLSERKRLQLPVASVAT